MMSLGQAGIPEVLIPLAVLCVFVFLGVKVARFFGRAMARVICVAFAVLFAALLWSWTSTVAAVP
jgi:hypothetical protein